MVIAADLTNVEPRVNTRSIKKRNVVETPEKTGKTPSHGGDPYGLIFGHSVPVDHLFSGGNNAGQSQKYHRRLANW